MRNLLILALLLLSVYIALCLFLFLTQRSQIYFPVEESRSPATRSMRLPAGDVELKIWVVDRAGPKALIYFGGNAEDVALNLPAFAATFPGHSLYLVNYRGYGGSSGSPSEQGLLADALAVYDEVKKSHGEISVFGRSLGTGVASHLASAREVERLVLVSPYDSLVNVARAHFRMFPVGLLMRDRFDSLARVPAIRAPTLAVIAGEDEVIPRARSEALVAAFPASQIQVEVIAGARHNSLDLSPQYLERIGKFLAD